MDLAAKHVSNWPAVEFAETKAEGGIISGFGSPMPYAHLECIPRTLDWGSDQRIEEARDLILRLRLPPFQSARSGRGGVHTFISYVHEIGTLIFCCYVIYFGCFSKHGWQAFLT